MTPPIDANGNYTYNGGAFAPSTFHWTYTAANPSDFYSSNISGAERLPNGNTLICEGSSGHLFEVDYEGNTVWDYVNPVKGNQIIPQGGVVMGNNIFRCSRYATNYAGFDGHDLVAQGPIEEGTPLAEIPCNANVLRLKLYLEGAFDETSNNMHTDLSDNGLLPINQPYNQSPWNYERTIDFSTPFNVPIVDWLLIEARDANDNNIIVETTSVLLGETGEIYAADGRWGGYFL